MGTNPLNGPTPVPPPSGPPPSPLPQPQQPQPADKPQDAPLSTVEMLHNRYVLVGPSGAHDWWQINDMEKMYAVVSVQSTLPRAEEMIYSVWNLLADSDPVPQDAPEKESK